MLPQEVSGEFALLKANVTEFYGAQPRKLWFSKLPLPRLISGFPGHSTEVLIGNIWVVTMVVAGLFGNDARYLVKSFLL